MVNTILAKRVKVAWLFQAEQEGVEREERRLADTAWDKDV